MNEGERTLALMDDALASGRATASDAEARELQELALALRDEAAAPTQEFVAAMESRVALGFSKEPETPRPPRPSRLRFRVRPAGVLAVAASALVALVVVASLLSGGGDDTTTSAGGGAEPDAAAPMQVPRSGDAVQAAPSRPAVGTAGAPRRVERAAQLTLAAPENELQRVAGDVAAIAERRRGFVMRSSFSTGGDAAAGGTFELRVPARSLDAALADLSRAATVRTRTESGEDVTAAYDSARDRLDAARAERRSLLRRLGAADSDREAERLRVRLDAVSREIAGLRRGAQSIRERASYATVAVTLEGRDGGGDSHGGGTMRDALDDAGDTLVGALGLLVRALAVALPLALLAGFGWLLLRAVRRRRRESALL